MKTNTTPIDDSPTLPETFDAEVISELFQAFDRYRHHPSEEIFESMLWFPATIQRMLDGTAAKVCICDWPAGVGKTTLNGCVLRTLSKTARDIGVIVFLSRIDQIESFIYDSLLPASSYAVLMAGNELTRGKPNHPKRKAGVPFSALGVGVENVDKAQVLIITKAMAENHLRHRAWSATSSLFYQGKPRLLCIADEETVRRRSYTVSLSSLKVATSILEERNVFPELQGFGRSVSDAIEQASIGHTINLPEMAQPVDYEDVQARLKIRDVEYAGNHIRSLVALSKTNHALIRKDEDGRSVLLNYEVKLPDDMPSILVLDAGARSKAIYQIQPEPVEWSPVVHKRFDNVTVQIEHGPSGKQAFWRNVEERIADSAAFIKAHPDATPLIIHPLEQEWRNRGDIRGLLAQHLSAQEMAKVHFVHWGAHNSENEHRDCNLVDCLTLFHKPEYVYEIDAYAAADRPIHKGIDDEDIRAVKDSHLALSLYQAIERSCSRVLEEDQAKPCLIRLRVPQQSSMATALPTVFPGIKVVQPATVNRENEVLAFLDKWISDRNGLSVTYPEVYEALGMRHNHFSKLMQRPIMQAALKAKGWKAIRSRPSRLVRL